MGRTLLICESLITDNLNQIDQPIYLNQIERTQIPQHHHCTRLSTYKLLPVFTEMSLVCSLRLKKSCLFDLFQTFAVA